MVCYVITEVLEMVIGKNCNQYKSKKIHQSRKKK